MIVMFGVKEKVNCSCEFVKLKMGVIMDIFIKMYSEN